jgi:hypothetical protein
MMESETRNVITVVFRKTNAVHGLLQRVSKITSDLQEVGRVTAVVTRVDFEPRPRFTFLILSDNDRIILTNGSQLVIT